MIKSIIGIYLSIGILMSIVSVNGHSHKDDTKFEKFIFFLTMTLFWVVGLFFPIRAKECGSDKVVIDKLNIGDKETEPQENDSFANGTAKFSKIENF